MSTLNELIHYCNENNPIGALLLTGEWGCGKTYLIEKDLTRALEKTHVIVKVSLFGITDANALRHDHEDEDHDHDEDHDEDHDHDREEEHDHDEDHDEDHDHDHEHEHEDEYDEHVWLSLRNARKLTAAIAEALAGIDAANADAIRENAAAYDAQLQELDAKYTETVENAALKTVLFGDRFPFRYLTDDYGLTYYAAFTGCSAESEASFETIAFLAGKADELNLPAVLTIEGGNHKIADTVISASAKADRKVLTMNSMQSVTSDDVKNGMTYLSIMEENLTVLKEALN